MNVAIDLGNSLKHGPATLRLPRMNGAEFYALCRRNENLRLERNAEREMVLSPPSDNGTESRGMDMVADLVYWNRSLKHSGTAVGSNGGFTLPNGARRSPDASWINSQTWEALTEEQKNSHAHLCPDFVIELLSASDTLGDAPLKMEEYVHNGARLGFLIDRAARCIHVYRPDSKVELLQNPASASAEPILPGFALQMARIF